MFFAQNRFVACSKEISSGSSDDDFRYTAASDVTTDNMNSDKSGRILDDIVNRYPTFVKCDFVQAPHHGITNHLPFYQAVDPTYFLLPINHTGYNTVLDNENGKNPANYWLAHVSAKMRHVVTTGNKTVSITLPFNPSDSEAIRAPKWNTKFKDYSYLF